MSDLKKHPVAEQTMRKLQQTMSEAAWAAASVKIASFLASLVERDMVWITPAHLEQLVTSLPLKERDALFRGILKFSRPMVAGGYEMEQLLQRPPALAVGLSVFLRIGESILEKPASLG